MYELIILILFLLIVLRQNYHKQTCQALASETAWRLDRL